MTNKENSTELLNGQSTEAGVLMKAERYSGPLPHPDILDRYNQVVPGAAERILQKFEIQTEHRIAIENKIVDAAIKKELLGLKFGFTIAIVTIVGGIYTAIKGGNPGLGGTISFTGLAMIVGAFVYSNKKQVETDK